MDQSITVLLADGRLIDAKLPDSASLSSSALVAKLVFGDQVTIDCKSIPPVWDNVENMPRSLELQTLRFLREADPQEMMRAIQNPDGRRPGNLLHLPPGAAPPPVKPPAAPAASGSGDPADPIAVLEKARTVNLDRASHLPNFIADEEANCYFMSPSQGGWQLSATVHSEVSFAGMMQSKQWVTPDGKLIPGLGIPAGCIGWSGGFGSYIKPVFDPECGTTLTYSKTMGKPGKQSLVYSFITPLERGCYPLTFSGFERAYSAHEGSVVIDAATGDVLSVLVRSRGFPKAYPISEIEESAAWGFVRIEGETHLLPVSYEKKLTKGSGGTGRVQATYSKHRHFEANTNLTF